MKWQLYDVHLQDEIPALGSGQRHVEVQEGRKWVHLRRPGSDRKHRVRLNKWTALHATLIGDSHAQPES